MGEGSRRTKFPDNSSIGNNVNICIPRKSISGIFPKAQGGDSDATAHKHSTPDGHVSPRGVPRLYFCPLHMAFPQTNIRLIPSSTSAIYTQVEILHVNNAVPVQRGNFQLKETPKVSKQNVIPHRHTFRWRGTESCSSVKGLHKTLGTVLHSK